jgi:phosphotransferase system IIB component
MSNEAKLQQVERRHAEAVAAFHDATRLRIEIQHERMKVQDKLQEASTLLHLLWRESADLFGDRASSHYRSEIGARIEKVTGKRPKP